MHLLLSMLYVCAHLLSEKPDPSLILVTGMIFSLRTTLNIGHNFLFCFVFYFGEKKGEIERELERERSVM